MPPYKFNEREMANMLEFLKALPQDGTQASAQ